MIQLCYAGDVVCDWSHRGAPTTYATRGITTHASYDQVALGLLQTMGLKAVRLAGYTPVFPGQ